MILEASSHKVVAKIQLYASHVLLLPMTKHKLLFCMCKCCMCKILCLLSWKQWTKLEMTNGEVPGTLYDVSENGWITQQLLKEWFHHHFLAFLSNIRPVLLLIDGHSTHYCSETIWMAAACKVVLCTLPSHTTHLRQLLDKGCFAPLKMAWCEICQHFSYLSCIHI